MTFSEEKLTELLSLSYDDAITSRKAEVVAFYSFLFNVPNPCASCQSKLKDYWDKLNESGLTLLNYKKMDKTNKKQSSQFKIRKDISFLQMDFGSSILFNNDTITDELALQYLKINPRRIANFEEYPDDWQELLKEPSKQVTSKQKTKRIND
ncbi:hypothetical protein [Capnocytophaga canis]|uniref:hypothetical protein n=1 Tax=Capnocytophaga canis TaxID=1848903 RepID=UPI0015629946|nr:hypothetical protein [Capnocytophaga canis]